ncbi:MAG: branched-chain amino acid transaminase [Planctomycetota bacterium]|nr:branched-chain amino acid transaminase [Planctomycetota bacterium]
MSINATEWIWHDGELVPWADAKVHVLAHGLHFGSSIFEGIRVYETARGPCFFRLREHVERMFDSARIYRMEIPFTREEVERACHEVVARNGLRSAYIRPVAYFGYGTLGLDPAPCPVGMSIAAVEWGRYLGSDAIENGVDVCVSSWARLAPNTVPTLAKAGGNYLSSQLITTEAKRHGYAEGIGLCTDGTISEGAGENLFVLRDGVVRTPGSAASILVGITRDSVKHICADLDLEVREESLPREILYLADEVFMTGTAAEITPVRSVDRIPVGRGGRGPWTQRIQERFFGLFDGSVEDTRGWLTPVEEA